MAVVTVYASAQEAPWWKMLESETFGLDMIRMETLDTGVTS